MARLKDVPALVADLIEGGEGGLPVDRPGCFDQPLFVLYVYLADPPSPLLPAVLSWRTLRSAVQRGYGAEAFKAVGWILLLTLSWSAGEAVGYLLGTPGKDQIF